MNRSRRERETNMSRLDLKRLAREVLIVSVKSYLEIHNHIEPSNTLVADSIRIASQFTDEIRGASTSEFPTRDVVPVSEQVFRVKDLNERRSNPERRVSTESNVFPNSYKGRRYRCRRFDHNATLWERHRATAVKEAKSLDSPNEGGPA